METVTSSFNNPLRQGCELNNKYKIIKHIATKKLFNIYLANDLHFRENVWIKELFVSDLFKRCDDGTNVEVDDNLKSIYEEYIDKFNEEARITRQLNNKHIIKVNDLFSENGTVYYVMENIEGETLSQTMLRRNKPLSEPEAISYLTQILDGLSCMHGKGFWHLDITPSNILIDNTGNIKFTDFGHCKLVDNESTIIADIDHDPIELQSFDDNNIGPWTDFYSLGASLYNLLTGKRPPAASEINEATANLYHFPTSVSKKMQRLILWMMTPNIFRRPQDINEINDFLYGMTGGEINDHTFKKNLSAAGLNGIKSPETVVISSDKDLDNEDEDGLSNKTLKAMQIFIFIAILAIICYFAYKALLGNGDSPQKKEDSGIVVKKEEKTESKVDVRSDVDVLSIMSEEEEAKKNEEAKQEEALKKEETSNEALNDKSTDNIPSQSVSVNSDVTDAGSLSSNPTSSSSQENNASSADNVTTSQNSPHYDKTDNESTKNATPVSSNTSDSSPTEHNKKHYNVIVGSFSTQENANLRVSELKAQGYSATIKFNESKNLYRVIVSADETTKDKIKARYSDSWVE